MKILPILITAFVLILQPATSYANNTQNLQEKIALCGKISQNSKRLACFDALLVKDIVQEKAVPQQSAGVSMAAVAPKVPQAIEEKQEQAFGKEHLKKTKEEQGPESISSSVIKLKKLLRGQWVITLANGQKWQQSDSAKLKLKVGNIVRLEKGFMRAVYLYKEGSNRSIRVKRIK